MSSQPRVSQRGAIILGLFLLATGIAHFAVSSRFDEIVPPWLPFGARFWTLASGVGELSVAIGLLNPRSRAGAGWAAVILIIAVYPANLYMAWDWRDHALSEQLVAFGRLPLQIPLVWWAWRIARPAIDR